MFKPTSAASTPTRDHHYFKKNSLMLRWLQFLTPVTSIDADQARKMLGDLMDQLQERR